jgi:short subunit dehydrogenase-like uncharacterized protein
MNISLFLVNSDLRMRSAELTDMSSSEAARERGEVSLSARSVPVLDRGENTEVKNELRASRSRLLSGGTVASGCQARADKGFRSMPRRLLRQKVTVCTAAVRSSGHCYASRPHRRQLAAAMADRSKYSPTSSVVREKLNPWNPGNGGLGTAVFVAGQSCSVESEGCFTRVAHV